MKAITPKAIHAAAPEPVADIGVGTTDTIAPATDTIPWKEGVARGRALVALQAEEAVTTNLANLLTGWFIRNTVIARSQNLPR